MPDVTPEVFRQVMGHFATGVAIVTTRHGNDAHGTTISAVSSVSLQPPLILICVDRASDIHDLIRASGVFAVNMLHGGQRDLAVALSQKGTPELLAAHRLESLPYRIADTGAPLLTEHLAWVECLLETEIEAGDHTIYVGRVAGAGVRQVDDGPLLHYQGRYRALGGSL